MTMYVANSRLHALTLEAVRWVAPSVRGLDLVPIGDDLAPGNWRVASLNVSLEDAAAARAEADVVEKDGRWVWVPDDHPLDGKLFSGAFAEARGQSNLPPSNPEDHPLLALAQAVQAATGEDWVTAITKERRPTPSRLKRFVDFFRTRRASPPSR